MSHRFYFFFMLLSFVNSLSMCFVFCVICNTFICICTHHRDVKKKLSELQYVKSCCQGNAHLWYAERRRTVTSSVIYCSRHFKVFSITFKYLPSPFARHFFRISKVLNNININFLTFWFFFFSPSSSASSYSTRNWTQNIIYMAIIQLISTFLR